MKKFLLLLGACIVLGSCSTGGGDSASGLMTLGDNSQDSQNSQEDDSQDSQGDGSQDSQGGSSQGSQGDNSQGSQGGSSQGSQGGSSQGSQGGSSQGSQGGNSQGSQGGGSQGSQGSDSQGSQGGGSQGSQGDGSQGSQGGNSQGSQGSDSQGSQGGSSQGSQGGGSQGSQGTKNNRMPELVINEVRTENSSPKAEFIEFKMKTAGNLGAMRVFILGNTNATKQTIYEFMPVEVKKDEYVVLHLRKVEEKCRDEYGTDLSESGGADSSTTARDFWLPGDDNLLHKEATVIYVLDQDDRVLDAVMFSTTSNSSWNKDYFAEAADFLFRQDAWKSANGNVGSPADALNSAGTTATRTICRDETAEDTNTASDWYVTATSSATPGKPNNPKRF